MRQFNLRFGLAGPSVSVEPPSSAARSHTGLSGQGRLNGYDRDILECAPIVVRCVPGAMQVGWFCRYGERREAVEWSPMSEVAEDSR